MGLIDCVARAVYLGQQVHGLRFMSLFLGYGRFCVLGHVVSVEARLQYSDAYIGLVALLFAVVVVVVVVVSN